MALSITATPDLTTVPPSVRVTVTDPSGAVPSATVIRHHADGTSGTVRTGDGKPAPLVNGSATLVDFEPPYGQQLTYVANGTAFSVPLTVAVNRVWLTHLFFPERSMPVVIADWDLGTRAVRQGIKWVIGRPDPIVVTDGARRRPQPTLTVRTASLPDLARMESLLSDGSVLLLNVPGTLGWGDTAQYIAVGDVKSERVVRYGPAPHRHWMLPYQVVSAPLGGRGNSGSGGGSGRTWADLAQEATTWADAAAQYQTWAAAAAGTSS